MTDARLKALLTCGLGMIIVSLDGATAETYVQYRRRGNFNLEVDNLRRLLALKASLGLTYPLIEWRFLRFRHNQHEEARVRAQAEFHVHSHLLIGGGVPGHIEPRPESRGFDPARTHAATRETGENPRRRFCWPTVGLRPPCGQPNRPSYVSLTGQLCCRAARRRTTPACVLARSSSAGCVNRCSTAC